MKIFKIFGNFQGSARALAGLFPAPSPKRLSFNHRPGSRQILTRQSAGKDTRDLETFAETPWPLTLGFYWVPDGDE